MKIPDPFPTPRRLTENSSWPQSWRESHHYDQLEVWGERFDPGYTKGYLSRRQHAVEVLLAHRPPPARVLDLAAAQGNFTVALAALGYCVTWNDLRAELMDYVRLKLPPDACVEFVAGNLFELGSAYLGAYDVVLALEVIEHVAHPDEFLCKLAKFVRPGGLIVISTPNGGYFLHDLPRFADCTNPAAYESVQFKPNSDGHIFLLHEDEIGQLSRTAGLELKRLDFITNPLTAGHMKLRYLLMMLPDAAVEALEALTRRLPRALRRVFSVHTVAVLARPS